MDQIAAKELGKETQLASLELALDASDCRRDVRRRLQLRLHQHDLLAQSPTTPLPMENNPRVVFERLFGDGGSTDPPSAAGAACKKDRSILDSVTEDDRRLCSAASAPRDRASCSEYLEAVRDVERRIQKAEQQSQRELPAGRAAGRHSGDLSKSTRS